MNEPTPSPYQPGSFEHAVITGIATLQTKMEGVTDELKRQNDTISDTIENVHTIQIEMAERKRICSVAEGIENRLVRRIKPLEEGALVARANKKTVFFMSGIVSGIVVFLYHLLHSIKAFAEMTGAQK